MVGNDQKWSEMVRKGKKGQKWSKMVVILLNDQKSSDCFSCYILHLPVQSTHSTKKTNLVPWLIQISTSRQPRWRRSSSCFPWKGSFSPLRACVSCFVRKWKGNKFIRKYFSCHHIYQREGIFVRRDFHVIIFIDVKFCSYGTWLPS